MPFGFFTANMVFMRRPLFRQRPLITIPQIVVFLVIAVSLIIAIDINRRNQVGRVMGGGEIALETQVDAEKTRQVELQATLEYVQSDDYVATYARNEAGFLLPGENRVVPLVVEGDPVPTPVPQPTVDPLEDAQPWQAWWQLLTDAPQPAPIR